MLVRVKKKFAESLIRDEISQYPEPMHKFILSCEVLNCIHIPNYDLVLLYNMETGDAAVCSGELFDVAMERVDDDS